MRLLTGLLLAAICLAQAPTSNPALKIPPVKASINLDQQLVEILGRQFDAEPAPVRRRSAADVLITAPSGARLP